MPQRSPLFAVDSTASGPTCGLHAESKLTASKRLIFISASATEREDGFGNSDVLFLSLAELRTEIITEFNPEAVVCSLFGQDDDATSIVARLGQIGFQGCCIVLTPPLPRPDLIRAELKSISPALNLELFSK